MSVKFVLLVVLLIIVQFAICSPGVNWALLIPSGPDEPSWHYAPPNDGHPYENFSDFENRHTNDFLWVKDIHYDAYYACINGYLYMFDRHGVQVNGDRFTNGNAGLRVSDTLKCLNCLAKLMILQPAKPRHSRSSIAVETWCWPDTLSVPIKNYRGRGAVDEKELSRRFLTAKTAVVRNEGNLTQEGSTPAYEKSVTETAETSFTLGGRVWSMVSVSLPLVSSAEFGIEFHGDWSKTDSKSWTETIMAPAQKVSVGPESQVRVKWSLYEFTRAYTYGVSFEIDDGATSNALSAGYKRLKEARHKNLQRANFNDGNEIWLGLKGDDALILHNVPMTEVATGHEVNYEISKAEPLNSHVSGDAAVYKFKPIH